MIFKPLIQNGQSYSIAKMLMVLIKVRHLTMTGFICCTGIKSSETVETIIEIIKYTLASGNDVLIGGFDKFCVKDKRERKNPNAATAEDVIPAPRRVAAFKCSEKLRDKINL